MANTGISEVENNVRDSLEGMISRGRSVSTYLNRVIFRKFQKEQNERWQTQNASQGESWNSLNPVYERYKKKKFASYEGGGSKMMIATGKLSQGARAVDPSYFYKLISDTQFIIGINTGTVAYAGYAGDARPFMSFSDDTLIEWKSGIRDYITKNQGGL